VNTFMGIKRSLITILVAGVAFGSPSLAAASPTPGTPSVGGQLTVSFRWQDGGGGTVVWTLKSDGTFTDDTGSGGTWGVDPASGVLTVQYADGCATTFTGIIQGVHLHGLMHCTEHILAHGKWTGSR
jgi:hypothetical protein